MATETIEKSLYNDKVNIVFYPKCHRYKLKGERSYLIGVTTATGVIDKSRVLMPWAVGLAGDYIKQYLKEGEKYTKSELLPIIQEALEQHTQVKDQAGSIGSAIHEWAEQFAIAKVNKTEINIPEDAEEQVINGIMAFLDWYNNNEVIFLEAERIVYSQKQGFVGTLDAVADINGKKYLIDYKTSKGIYDDYFFQVSAYYKAYKEETGTDLDGAMIVRFGKEDGQFEVREITKGELVKNYKAFKACLELKKRLKEMQAEYYKNRKK